MTTSKSFQPIIDLYNKDIVRTLEAFDWTPVHALADEFLDCWKNGRQVFFCGNGGSAANAIHMANDFLYGISKTLGSGLKCHALPANSAVVTCLANDEGYENVFGHQLAVMANPGDVLVVLSGSGNSPNILQALKIAKDKGMKSFGILGYTGGKAKALVDTAIHFAIDDMEISEDLQMIVAHMVKRHLWNQRESVLPETATTVTHLKTA